MAQGNMWAADVPISMPVPPTAERPVIWDLGGSGWGMTTGGICHLITDADREEMFSQFFAPVGRDPTVTGPSQSAPPGSPR